jgi:uncharacterized caspase-like protein
VGKFALLIGVGDYRSTAFAQLAAAVPDVKAMQTVLQDPAVGGFAIADVMTLLNPDPQQMREALERLFSERKSDDLLMLYFSGHGVVDDAGRFHLTTAHTEKEWLHSTAIAASFIHGLMENSRSKRQVVILDCCFSGAFAKGMMAKGDAVNFQAQLGGKGRAVLTSSSATEYSFEQKEAELSVYTQYMVEGLRTGIADKGGDGWISVDELHEFAEAKVRETSPAMQPKIYAVEEGYKIILAKAPMGDPELEYRKAVEQLAVERQGKLSARILMALEEKQRQWGLDSALALAIRQEVLRPYEEFAAKLQKYQQALQEDLRSENQLSTAVWEDLQYFQRTLGLTDENIQPLVSSIEIIPLVITPKFQQPIEKSIAAPQPLPKVSKSQTQIPLVITPKFQQPIEKSIATPQPLPKVSKSVQVQTQNRTPQKSIKISIQTWLVGGVISSVLSIGVIWQHFQSQTTPSSPLSLIGSRPLDEKAKNSNITAEDLLKMGFDKYNKEDYKGAIEDYDQAIKLKPDYADAYYNRGIARSDLGDNKGAIADYDQAIKLKPDFAEAYYGRGNARSNLSDNKGAIADYNQAIELKPDYADAYINRGNARSKLGDIKEAIADYKKAVELYPTASPLRQPLLDEIKRLQE